MIKKIPLFIFLFLSFVCFSQEIKIQVTVTDSSTNTAQPFATIYLKNAGIGKTTNLDGKTEIVLNKVKQKTDTLICSYVGYRKEIIPIDITKSQEIFISLKSSSIALEELQITYKKALTTKQILKNVIKNTKTNYSNQAVNLLALYRETFKEDNRNIYLNEASVNIHYTQYPQAKSNILNWQDWFYDDTYAFEFKYSQFDGFPNQFNSKLDKVKLIEARSSENWSQYNFNAAITGGPLSITSKDYIKYQYDFLNPDLFKKYTYVKKESEFINNHTCYVLHFYPNETNKKMVIDFSKKLNRSIYVGKMYIDKESFAIVKTEYQLAKNVDFGYYTKFVPLDYKVTVDYQKDNSTWNLNKITLSQIRAYKMKTSVNKVLYESYQELIITKIITDSVKQIPVNEQWKHTRITALRNFENPYTPIYWEKYKKEDYPSLDEKIKQDLETEKPLENQFISRFKQKENLSPPIAKKENFIFNYPFENVTDNYQWFADSTKSIEFYKYIDRENKYAENYIIPFKSYQKDFFKSLNKFYPEDTTKTQITHKAGEYYYDEDSLGNTIFYEYSDSINRIAILNQTKFKENRSRCYITSIKASKTQLGILYTSNGGLNNNLIILKKGSLTVIDSISDIYSYEWFNDSLLLYTPVDVLKRSDKLYSRNILHKKDSLLMFEKDLTYDISVSQTKSYLVCTIQSMAESELYLLKKGNIQLAFNRINQRQEGVYSSVKEFDNQLYVQTNENAINSKVCVLEENNTLKEIIPHNPKIYIGDYVITENYIVLKNYKNSFIEVKYKLKNSNKWKLIDFKTEIFDVTIVNMNNDKLKIYYSNPKTPSNQYVFNLKEETLTKVESIKIKRQFQYGLKGIKTERVWAKTKGGVKIPMTLVKSRYAKKEHKGLILKSYGCYGSFGGGYGFSSEDVALVEDGYTIVYAYVRGGGEMGQQWHFDGKLLNKENSFNDYIACAEYLIEKKYTDPNHLIGYGVSAGGTIMGVVINRRPELFNTIILDHPYLDVLNTMMNDSLPLTTDHYKEIGNPNQKEYYDYIKAYSPYQNIKKQDYPNLLFIASSNDYQTPTWQVANYVAKLREYNTGSNTILFKTDIGSGHIGSTFGMQWLKDLSFQNAFIYGNLFK